ncbi:MAG: hypothetical protein ACYDAO_07230 [Thermoplasmataceae archaeon]
MSITITSNYTIILTVYGLNGDPSLTWAYIPSASVPPPSHKIISSSPANLDILGYYAIGVIVIIIASVGAVSVMITRRRKR